MHAELCSQISKYAVLTTQMQPTQNEGLLLFRSSGHDYSWCCSLLIAYSQELLCRTALKPQIGLSCMLKPSLLVQARPMLLPLLVPKQQQGHLMPLLNKPQESPAFTPALTRPQPPLVAAVVIDLATSKDLHRAWGSETGSSRRRGLQLQQALQLSPVYRCFVQVSVQSQHRVRHHCWRCSTQAQKNPTAVVELSRGQFLTTPKQSQARLPRLLQVRVMRLAGKSSFMY